MKEGKIVVVVVLISVRDWVLIGRLGTNRFVVCLLIEIIVVSSIVCVVNIAIYIFVCFAIAVANTVATTLVPGVGKIIISSKLNILKETTQNFVNNLQDMKRKPRPQQQNFLLKDPSPLLLLLLLLLLSPLLFWVFRNGIDCRFLFRCTLTATWFVSRG